MVKKLTLQEAVNKGLFQIPKTLGFLKIWFNIHFERQKTAEELMDREKQVYYRIRADVYEIASNYSSGKDRVRFIRKAKASRMMQNEYEKMREPCLVH